MKAQDRETVLYYAEAVDLCTDELTALVETPEKFPEREPKIRAILRNAAHAMRRVKKGTNQ